MYELASTSAIQAAGHAFMDAGAIITIATASSIAGGVGLLGLCFAISHLQKYITGNAFGDESLRIGGFYLRKLPYKGYKRFHSQEWNLKHMP